MYSFTVLWINVRLFCHFSFRNKLVDGTEVIQEVHSKPKSPGPPLQSGSGTGSPSSQHSKVRTDRTKNCFSFAKLWTNNRYRNLHLKFGNLISRGEEEEGIPWRRPRRPRPRQLPRAAAASVRRRWRASRGWTRRPKVTFYLSILGKSSWMLWNYYWVNHFWRISVIPIQS